MTQFQTNDPNLPTPSTPSEPPELLARPEEPTVGPPAPAPQPEPTDQVGPPEPGPEDQPGAKAARMVRSLSPSNMLNTLFTGARAIEEAQVEAFGPRSRFGNFDNIRDTVVTDRLAEQRRYQESTRPPLEPEKKETTEDGLNVPNKSEAADIARQYFEHVEGLAGAALREAEREGDFDEISGGKDYETALQNPLEILRRSGYTDEYIAKRREEFYKQKGYATPENTYLDPDSGIEYSDEAANPGRAEASREFLAKQAEESRRIYASIGMGFLDETQESLAEYVRETYLPDDPLLNRYLERNKGLAPLETPEQIARLSVTRDSARMLSMQAMARRQSYETDLRRDLAQNPDAYDDIEEHEAGVFSYGMDGFVHSAEVTPSALAVLGINIRRFLDKHGNKLFPGLGVAGGLLGNKFSLTGAFEPAMNALGYDIRGAEDAYIQSTGEWMAALSQASELEKDRILRENFRGNPDYEKILKDGIFTENLGLDAAYLAGMLTFDIGTGLFTGRPGFTTATRAMVKAPVQIAGALTRESLEGLAKGAIRIETRPGVVRSVAAQDVWKYMGTRGTSAQAAAGASARPATTTATKTATQRTSAQASAAGITDNLADLSDLKMVAGRAANIVNDALTPIATRTSRILTKDLNHGPNTFLARVYGESYAGAMLKYQYRAEDEGRGMNDLDSFYAQMDALAATGTAYLIGRNIFGRNTKLGDGSNGLWGKLKTGGWDPLSIASANHRQAARHILGINKSGADFGMFMLLTDAYQLTDRQDRAQVLFRYLENTDRTLKDLFGQYIIGAGLGFANQAAAFGRTRRAEMTRLMQMRDGYKAYEYIRNLPTEKQVEVVDRLVDNQMAGLKLRMQREAAFGRENPEALKEVSTEALREIVYHGDRAVNDVQRLMTEGISGELEARMTIDAHRITGENSRALINADGRVEVTKMMAMHELHRRGESTHVAMFEGGRIDGLFLSRAEMKARRANQRELMERAERATPPKPTREQVRGVLNFVTDLQSILGETNSARGSFRKLNTFDKQRVFLRVTSAALHAAQRAGNASSVRAIRQAIRRGKAGAVLTNPELRPFLGKSMRQLGHMARNNKQSHLIRKIVTSNPILVPWLTNLVQNGRNTLEKPVVTRQIMDLLAGGPGRVPREFNNKASRYQLGRMIAREASRGLTGEVRTIGEPKRPSTRVIETRPETGIPLEQARTTGEVAKSAPGERVSKEALAQKIGETREEFNRRAEEAEQGGQTERGLDPIPLVERPTKPDTSGKPKEIDAVIERVEPRVDGKFALDLSTPVRTPVEVRDQQGNPIFAKPLQRRVADVLKRLRDMGIESVEVDFGENINSLAAESTFALGRANGFSVMVAHGGNAKMPAVMNMGNGVLVLKAGAPVGQVRGMVAAHGASLAWARSLTGEKPGSWLFAATMREGNLAKMKAAWEAMTGQTVSTAEFRNGLTVEGTGRQAAVFEQVFRSLPPEIRAEIIANRPREMAQWFSFQRAGMESVGFSGGRANRTVMGGRKASEKIEAIANGEIDPHTSKGKAQAEVVKAINEGVERQNAAIQSASEKKAEMVAKRKAAEEALPKPPEEKAEGSTAETTRKEIDRQHENAGEIEFVVGGEPQMTLIKQLEQRFPGLMVAANTALKSSVGDMSVSFEHMGMHFTVRPELVKGKAVPGALIVRDPAKLDKATMRELLLTEEQKQVSDQAKDLVTRSEDRSSTTVDQLDRQNRREERQEREGEAPPPGVTEFQETPTPPVETPGLRASAAELMKSIMDPLNLGLLSGNEGFLSGIKKLITRESSATESQIREQDKIRRILRELERDPTSELMNKEGSLLAEILDTKIEPTIEAMKNHELTRNLSEREMELIAEIRKPFEEQRLYHIETMRDAVGIRYKSQANAEQIAKTANADKPELGVRVVSEAGTARKMFEFNLEGEKVRRNRDEFIEFMKEAMVPESYGYKHGYFPHMFFGDKKAKVEVFKDGKLIMKSTFGAGEQRGAAQERLDVMKSVEQFIEGHQRANEGTPLSFKVNMTEAPNRLPTDTIYMPRHIRQRMVSAIRSNTGAYASEINGALRGRISSQPTARAFNQAMLERTGAKNFSKDVGKVLEIAIANHYRHKMSREIQKDLKPIVESLEKNASTKWMAEYLQELGRHTVFGSKGRVLDFLRDRGPVGQTVAKAGETVNNALRTFQFYRQLSRVAQHAINSTQALQVWSITGSKFFFEGMRDYRSNGDKWLAEWGRFDLNGRYDPGKFGDSLGPRGMALQSAIHQTLNRATGKFWNANSEARNQNFSAFMLAKWGRERHGMSAQEAAEYGNLYGQVFTQYRWLKSNEPRFLRGSYAKTLLQFKRFPVQSLGMLASLSANAFGRPVETTQNGAFIPRGALARFMVLNTVLGGARGSLLGGAYFLGAGIAGYGTSYFKNLVDPNNVSGLPNAAMSQEAAYKYLRENTDDNIAEAVMFGAGSIFGIDASQSFNLTNMGSDPLEFFMGPSLSMFKRMFVDIPAEQDVYARSTPTRMIEEIIKGGAATRSVANLLELMLYWDELGVENSKLQANTFLGLYGPAVTQSGTGQLINYKSKFEALLGALGFRGVDTTTKFLMHASLVRFDDHIRKARTQLGAIYEKDWDEGEKARMDWNAKYGAAGIFLYATDILDQRDSNDRARNMTIEDRSTDRMYKRVKMEFDK